MNTLRTYGLSLIASVLLLAMTHCGGGSLDFSDEPLSENPEPPAAPAQPTAPTPSSASPRLAGSTLFNLNQSRFGTETQTASSENFQLVNITFHPLEAK